MESSVTYLEQAERYEMMSEVYKLLQPFYEKTRDFEKMKEMYGKLHVAFKRVVEIMATGKRYLGTYFRIAFYGKVNSNIQHHNKFFRRRGSGMFQFFSSDLVYFRNSRKGNQPPVLLTH